MYRRSIAVFPYRESEPRFLLLKRVAARGSHWQPVTGRVEDGDGLMGARARYRDVIAGARRTRDAGQLAEREDLLVAALREMEEEIGVADVLTVVDLGLDSRFKGYDGLSYAERAFAAEVPDDARVIISDEHEDARWCTFEEAMELLHWDENKEALRRLKRFLEAGDASDEDTGLAVGPGR